MQTFFILSSIVLGFATTSYALDVGGTLSDVLPLSKCDSSVGVFTNVPIVKLFVDAFIQAISKSDTLRNLFDLSNTTSQQYANFVKKDIEQVLTTIGVNKKTASTVAKFGAKGIPQIDKLTMPIVARAIANMVVNFVFVDGDLTIENAANLATSLAKTMEVSAIANMASDPLSKFVAVKNGFVFLPEKELSLELVPLVALYVGNEWMLAANNPC